MSIKDSFQKIKSFFQESELRSKLLTVAIIFLVGTASFGLGRLSILDSRKEPVRIENIPLQAQIPRATILGEEAELREAEEVEKEPEIVLKAGGMVVASKNSDKYHFPWCSGAKRILEENKIYFASIEEAKAAGYTPAGNCKGLE